MTRLRTATPRQAACANSRGRGAGASSSLAGAPAPHAVMEQRAPVEVECDTPEQALWRKLDFFPTPPWAARSVAEVISELTPHNTTTVEDPACGMGHFGEPLREYFDFVGMSDIHDYGRCYDVRDFLAHGSLFHARCGGRPEWIATNPPFLYAIEFLRAALAIVSVGVAFICRTSFLHSEERYSPLYVGPHRLTLFAPFIERPAMKLGRWEPDASTATEYSAFFFVKDRAPMAPRPIVPGTKLRLTRPGDVRRFAHVSPLPLLEGMAAA